MITKINVKNKEYTVLNGAVEITYAELKALRDNSKLVAGTNYIITDYECTTTTVGTGSAGHQFDIIVVADSPKTLNENARARKHEGDTYFAECDLSAWELKYSLDNDKMRFDWADETNGKGVIFYMKDEHNNECPYDFKNLKYVFKIGFTYNQWGTDYIFERDESLDKQIEGVQYYGYKSSVTPTAWSENVCFVKTQTINKRTTLYKTDGTEINYGGSILKVQTEYQEYYTFNCEYLDITTKKNSNCYRNVITPLFFIAYAEGGPSRAIKLNNIYLLAEYASDYINNNIFKECSYITLVSSQFSTFISCNDLICNRVENSEFVNTFGLTAGNIELSKFDNVNMFAISSQYGTLITIRNSNFTRLTDIGFIDADLNIISMENAQNFTINTNATGAKFFKNISNTEYAKKIFTSANGVVCLTIDKNATEKYYAYYDYTSWNTTGLSGLE